VSGGVEGRSGLWFGHHGWPGGHSQGLAEGRAAVWARQVDHTAKRKLVIKVLCRRGDIWFENALGDGNLYLTDGDINLGECVFPLVPSEKGRGYWKWTDGGQTTRR